MNFLNLSASNEGLLEELEEVASKVIRSGLYLHGPETKAFEKELADQCEAKYAIGVSNGLDAIRLIFRAYIELGRLRKGDAVMVAANTYIATVIPITELGLIPVFVEPDTDTMNFSWKEAERLLMENEVSHSPLNIRVAIITHLYGTPCWNLLMAEKMRSKGMWIVEDNAQAIGAVAAENGFNGVAFTGNLADAAAYSFYPTKNVGALGDAGAVVTNDSIFAATVKALANYGTDCRYHNLFAGYNCRLDEIQAAMLRIKLRHLSEVTRARKRIADIYTNDITNPLVDLPQRINGAEQVWHQYVILVAPEIRDSLRQYLTDNGVPTDVHYPVPPYLQPCYREAFQPKDRTPSIILAESCISLPIANISPAEAADVAQIINDFRS